ncbi:restriction endonuclease subunit S [Streptomyces shenzhenensis]|uniref:restriction endonuclease subunit S n=1 Tax=Streptomyces shenzhenensis TaxID=943815 RepID=UPI001F2338F0|nr:restriction endonuclease subunit S [Streptomyces shenzhenensis]
MTVWSKVRLKNLCVDAGQYGLNTSAENYVESGVRLLRTTDISSGRLTPTEDGVFVSDLPEERFTLKEGDILLSRSGTPPGQSYLVRASDAGATFAGYLVRFRPLWSAEPRFLAYVARSEPFQHKIRSESVASTIQNFNAERYANIDFRAPGLEEQRRIANFLDAEIGKIDDLVSKKERLVSLMDERINSQVLQYIGSSQLVRHTTGHPALPIRRILTKVVRPAVADVGVITAYRDGQVTERSLRRAEGYTLSSSADPQGQSVQVGDVVVHGLDGFAGAIGTSEAIGNCSPVYHVCTPTGDGDAYFLGRLLRLLALQGYLGNFATSTRERAVDFRNWDLFGRIPIPVVPPDGQREIGDRIKGLRPLRELIVRSETLAAERRQALITAAVSGQFDVSTASGRNVTDGVTA